MILMMFVEAAGRDLDAATMALEVFLFKMKANGKELDPKHFDADERNAFRDLDLKEAGRVDGE